MTKVREYQRIFQSNDNFPTINIEDIAIVHEVSTAYVMWKMGIIEDVIKGARQTYQRSSSENLKI